ncbi:MAG: hypothetical protein ACFCVK_19930 [Acidimicrobiales bacterium]
MSAPSASEIRSPFNANSQARAWSRPPERPARTRPSARLLEIGVAEAEGIEFIVHAMAARPKYLET